MPRAEFLPRHSDTRVDLVIAGLPDGSRLRRGATSGDGAKGNALAQDFSKFEGYAVTRRVI
jgi:hypothetical protein